MRWISSAGGPLILLPASVQRLWRGVVPPAQDGRTDYELACEVEGYVGVIVKQGVQVLVLNDEPLQTAVFQQSGRVYLARWCWAPSHEAAEAALEVAAGLLSAPVEQAGFQVSTSPLVLMDAAADGQSPGETLSFELEPGHYEVRVYDYSPAADLRLLVCELAPK